MNRTIDEKLCTYPNPVYIGNSIEGSPVVFKEIDNIVRLGAERFRKYVRLSQQKGIQPEAHYRGTKDEIDYFIAVENGIHHYWKWEAPNYGGF